MSTQADARCADESDASALPGLVGLMQDFAHLLLVF
jgi:hypothetical protein